MRPNLPMYFTLIFISIPVIIPISIPVIQQLLLRPRRRLTWPIALLMYIPGFLFVLFVLRAVDDNTRGGGRLEFAYVLTSPEVFGYLLTVFLITGLYTLIFEVLRRLRANNWAESGEPRFTPGLYRPMASILILLLVICIFLANYESLEDAVVKNDLDLARRRLEFNLAGAGPNNGRIESWGTAGIHTSPLLPLAVRNGSIEMAALLIQSGAELNPRLSRPGVYRGSNPEWNMLYYATINDDMPMLEFLVEQGADPTRNIVPTVSKRNVGHLEFLLSHGADIEAVRDDLRDQKLEGALDEMLDELANRSVTN